MNILLDILEMKRPHGGRNEQRVIFELLSDLPGEWQAFYDDTQAPQAPMGFLYTTNPESTTLFVAHLDTVHQNELLHNPVKFTTEAMWKEDGEPLGADDGAGVWLLYKMAQANVPGTYLFTVGEEKGGVGAKYIAQNCKEFLEQFDKAIAFDRRGTTSIITQQGWGNRCCSDEFAKSLASKLNEGPHNFEPDNTGIYTDTAEFIDIIPECTNISVGYLNEHSGKETLDLFFLRQLLVTCIQCDWESLPSVRDPKAKDYQSSYQNWLNYEGKEINLCNLANMTEGDIIDLAWDDPETTIRLLLEAKELMFTPAYDTYTPPTNHNPHLSWEDTNPNWIEENSWEYSQYH